MKRPLALLGLLLALTLAAAACRTQDPAPDLAQPPPTAAAELAESAPETAPEATPEAAPVSAPEQAGEEPIYLAILWHQHQPVYFKDPETGVYVRPWVRVHATKDYVDMAAILLEYPDVHVTFNMTPSLIRQLDDLAAGARDLYWVYAEIPAEDLDDVQKQFLLDRFFDTNRRIIQRFPRYQQLLDLRERSDDPLTAYSTQDYRDLQVLFNLAWVDPDWLAEEPLAGLVRKGRDFDEADKAVLFAEHLRLIEEVIPLHRKMQEAGQIEVSMTPFAHPILPLLVNTDLARQALPDLELPGSRFAFGQDAVAQVERGVGLYQEHFGRAPTGMWPAEGSVAQEIISMVARNGIRWMATDEGVLANSLGMDSFTRNAGEVVVEADQLYRPYYVEGLRHGPVAVVFRDTMLSDKVGFTYSGMDGDAAAEDFVDRIHAIRDSLQDSGAEGPHLVSVILDGENAWEFYENDGKAFLHGLYRRLSDDPLIRTVTPSEFLDLAPDQPRLETLWAGSWISHDFATWIGEEEENRAWDLLAETREFLQQFITGSRQGEVGEEALERALTQMYIAEGSDWFWWYGADQNSGNDQAFDLQFRETLRQVYRELGQEEPLALEVPIIPEQAVAADRANADLIAPAIDGVDSEGEWDAAGLYLASGGAQAAGVQFYDDLAYGFGDGNFYLRLAYDAQAIAAEGDAALEIYLSVPGGGSVSALSRAGGLLGFRSNRLVELAFESGSFAGVGLYQAADDSSWTAMEVPELEGAVGSGLAELAVPLDALGAADTGDSFTFRAFYQAAGESGSAALDLDQIPGAGPATIALPDLGTTTILVEVTDPASDDYGPGTYTYPGDSVFGAGSYDILTFQAGFDQEYIVFRFVMRGPVDNPWSSPNGLSVQTFDVYIDVDGEAEGASAMLPGRNLSVRDAAWDYAVTVEGWQSGIFVPGPEGPQRIAEQSEFQILADPAQRKVTIRVPKSILGEDPGGWRFAAVVLSQEGFPSAGVQRVRDVLPQAEQWRVGGAPAGGTNHTRVIDLVWPQPGEQEGWLSDISPVNSPQTELIAEDFAAVPLFGVE